MPTPKTFSFSKLTVREPFLTPRLRRRPRRPPLHFIHHRGCQGSGVKARAHAQVVNARAPVTSSPRPLPRARALRSPLLPFGRQFVQIGHCALNGLRVQLAGDVEGAPGDLRRLQRNRAAAAHRVAHDLARLGAAGVAQEAGGDGGTKGGRAEVREIAKMQAGACESPTDADAVVLEEDDDLQGEYKKYLSAERTRMNILTPSVSLLS